MMQAAKYADYTLAELQAAGITAVSVETILGEPVTVVHRVCPRCASPSQILQPSSAAPKALWCAGCGPEIDLDDAADARKMRRERERWQPTLRLV